MAGPAQSQTVSEKSRLVRQRFLYLISLLQDQKQHETPQAAAAVSPAIVTDALERFTLWAGNLGAMRNPQTTLSLDHRLHSSEAADVRTYILRQLDEIVEAVESGPLPSPTSPRFSC
jgi:hypothetical protein